jgi:chorismate mutase
MPSPDNSDVTKWRKRIDELDLELIRILNERASCAIEIGKIKRQKNLPIYDPKREESVVQMMIEHNPGPLDVEGVRSLFERIIDESRRIERVAADRDDALTTVKKPDSE